MIIIARHPVKCHAIRQNAKQNTMSGDDCLKEFLSIRQHDVLYMKHCI